MSPRAREAALPVAAPTDGRWCRGAQRYRGERELLLPTVSTAWAKALRLAGCQQNQGVCWELACSLERGTEESNLELRVMGNPRVGGVFHQAPRSETGGFSPDATLRNAYCSRCSGHLHAGRFVSGTLRGACLADSWWCMSRTAGAEHMSSTGTPTTHQGVRD
jgi:hypothetical protein